MALTAIAASDAAIAVFDAKYHYEFWRPITAIRNGDRDDNPATERDATWQPIDNTRCIRIISTAVAAPIEAILGTAEIPEAVMTSPTAPGVTHRWTNIRAYADEVAHARIWAGFHYRFGEGRPGHGPDDRSIRRAECDAAGERRGRALMGTSTGSVVSNPAAAPVSESVTLMNHLVSSSR